jgi:malonyl-CoA O-methyltransferase
MKEFIIEQSFMQRAYQRVAKRMLQGHSADFFLQKQLRQRLLDALSDLNLKPHQVVEFGCANGELLAQLEELYPAAKVVGVDLIAEMLELCPSALNVMHADAEAPPMPDDSFDLIVSNCLLPMLSDPFKVAAEWLRVLKSNGTVCFTTLGPDSFCEIKQAFAQAGDTNPHTHAFYDMHDVGDAWRAAGGADVVLHCERQQVLYSKPQDIAVDLHNSGIVNASFDRRRGLTGKSMWRNFLESYPRNKDNTCPLTLEVILVVVNGKLGSPK